MRPCHTIVIHPIWIEDIKTILLSKNIIHRGGADVVQRLKNVFLSLSDNGNIIYRLGFPTQMAIHGQEVPWP